MDLPKNVTLEVIDTATGQPAAKGVDHPDKKRFELYFDLTKEDSYWKGGKYKFTVTIDNDYPHKPPRVHCTLQFITLTSISKATCVSTS